MKLRKLFMTLLLALGVGASAIGVGTAVATTTTNEPEVAEAAATDTIDVFFQNNWSWTDVCVYFWGSSGTNPGWPGNKLQKNVGKLNGSNDHYIYQLPKDVKGVIFNGIKNDGSGNRDQTPDIISGFANGICYYMKWDNGNKTGTFQIYKTIEYKVKGTDKSVEISSAYYDNKTKIKAATTFTTFSEIGYSYKGIFKDEKCTNAFESFKAADTLEYIVPLYHKFEKLNEDYIYIPEFDSALYTGTEFYIYSAIDNKEFPYGAWHGTKIILEDYEVACTFNGKKLYKVPVYSHEKIKEVMFTNNGNYDDCKTKMLTLNFGNYYDVNKLRHNHTNTNVGGDSELGKQAQLADLIASSLKNDTTTYKYDGVQYENSLCSLSKEKISAILELYEKDGGDVFDSSIFTSNKITNESDDKYTGEEVIKALRIRYQQLNGGTPYGMNKLLLGTIANNDGVFIAILSVSSLITIAFIFFLRSKKFKINK